jgi:hypothetical protein
MTKNRNVTVKYLVKYSVTEFNHAVLYAECNLLTFLKIPNNASNVNIRYVIEKVGGCDGMDRLIFSGHDEVTIVEVSWEEAIND